MNILTKNNTVKMYVEPIITGKSITLIASKYNLPIPGQSNTASVIIAPPNDPDKLSASMVTIGGAAFRNAWLYTIFFLLILLRDYHSRNYTLLCNIYPLLTNEQFWVLIQLNLEQNFDHLLLL